MSAEQTPIARPPHAAGRARLPWRYRLLAEAGLAWAPPARQHEFWRRRNSVSRRGPERLGAVIDHLFRRVITPSATRLAPLQSEWGRLIPEAFRPHTQVIAVRAGRLIVAVDDAAVRFAIERELKETLLRALRATSAGARVHDIVCQLAAMPVDSYDPERRGPSSLPG